MYFFVMPLIVLGVIYYLYQTIQLIIRCRKLKQFPGPMPLPIIGNCYDTAVFTFLRYVTQLRKRYGKVFTCHVFLTQFLVLCDPVIVRRVLSDSKTFIKGDDYQQYFGLAFGQGLVTSNGEKHKHDRSIFGRFFIRSFVAKFTPVINMLTKDAVEKVFSDADGKKSYNIEEFFAVLALRSFSMFAFSKDLRGDAEFELKICHLVSKGSLAVGELAALRPPIMDLVPQVSYVRKARVFFGELLKKWMHEREMLMQSDPDNVPDDCLTTMLKEKLDFEDMLDHTITLLAAGHDTTAYFSSYLCFLLAQNPEAQDKVLAEINEILGDREEVTADDAAQMKYLQKCMQECLRLYAIIPLVTRLATEDVHIKEAEITIPAGTTIMVPMFLINRDPELWENPSDFNPDRFDGKGTAEFTSAKNGFFPFSYGSRLCIGNVFAQLESTTFFVYILRKYRIVAKSGFKPNILSGISLTTSNGIHVILEPRK